MGWTAYQVQLIGLGLKVLLGSLNEHYDIREGANCILEREGGREGRRERGREGGKVK